MGFASPAAACATPSTAVVREFLRWTRSAPADARAQGARSLALAYLDGDLDPVDRADALHAMTALLDDRSPLVRLALAEALAPSAGAPHPLVTALAQDGAAVAAVVLSASPLLTEAELVDAVALGCGTVQGAVARRAAVSPGVAAALAEVGAAEACAVLCANPGAEVTPRSLARILERHGADADVRRVLLDRSDLQPEARHDLAAAVADTLARFVAERAWLSADAAARLVRDALDQACLTIAADTARRDGADRARPLVAHLRAAGRLTPALLIRAVLRGHFATFEAAMSELSGVPLARVAGLLRGGRALGFGALYAKAGLPPALLPVFQAAVFDPVADPSTDATLQRRRIARALRACAAADHPHLAKAGALLRRLEAEAARDEARAFAREVEGFRDTPASRLPGLSAADRVSLRPAA